MRRDYYVLIGRTMSGRTESAQPEDHLIGAAAEYFSRSFPNPRREGCLHTDRLRALASSADPVGRDVRTHLFQCSECFIEFRRERLAVASAADSATTPAMPATRRVRVRRMVTVAASMVVGAGLGLALWRGYVRTASQKPASGGTPSASLAATNLTTTHPATELPAVVTIQLQPSSLRRGPSASLESSVPPVAIRPRPLRVEIELPDGYPDGVYLVAIVDPFDEALIEVTVPAVGRSIVALVDATGLASGRRFVRIQRSGQPPDYVPVVVDRPSPR
jgi:hypothetical protein